MDIARISLSARMRQGEPLIKLLPVFVEMTVLEEVLVSLADQGR